MEVLLFRDLCFAKSVMLFPHIGICKHKLWQGKHRTRDMIFCGKGFGLLYKNPRGREPSISKSAATQTDQHSQDGEAVQANLERADQKRLEIQTAEGIERRLHLRTTRGRCKGR